MVVVTLDADFHAEMALSGANSPSVIRVRIEGLRGPELAALLKSVVGRVRAQLEAGTLVTVSHRRLAWRRLPLVR
jgi:predicted nuclease of predicted toxin-antitoxin system